MVHRWGDLFQVVEGEVKITRKPGITMAGQRILAREITEANAAFIVRACNNFEGLLGACKAALDTMYHHPTWDNSSLALQREILKQAIAKAERST